VCARLAQGPRCRLLGALGVPAAGEAHARARRPQEPLRLAHAQSPPRASGPARQGPPATACASHQGGAGGAERDARPRRAQCPFSARTRPGSRCRRALMARGRGKHRWRRGFLCAGAAGSAPGSGAAGAGRGAPPCGPRRASGAASARPRPRSGRAGGRLAWLPATLVRGRRTRCPLCAGPSTGRPWQRVGGAVMASRRAAALQQWRCPEPLAHACAAPLGSTSRAGRQHGHGQASSAGRPCGARLLDRAERGRQVAAAARARGLGGRLPAAQHVEREPEQEVRQRRQAHVRAARAVHQQPPAVLRPALQLGASRRAAPSV